MDRNDKITILGLVVLSIIVGFSVVNGISWGLSQFKDNSQNPFMSYTKIIYIKNNYTLYPAQTYTCHGDDCRPSYYFDFIDGSGGFFTTGEITNPYLSHILHMGFYNLTYSNILFTDYPIIIDIISFEKE